MPISRFNWIFVVFSVNFTWLSLAPVLWSLNEKSNSRGRFNTTSRKFFSSSARRSRMMSNATFALSCPSCENCAELIVGTS